MDKYDFFYGMQAVEFERPIVPDVVATNGIEIDIVDRKNSLKIVGEKYSFKIKPTKTKVVILNVHD